MFSVHRALLGVICLGGFWLTWEAGHRGVFLLDQSMIFDGAWRILQGQIPYRDFFMPFGPVSFGLQAFFSAILGMTWSSTVASAAVSQILATLLAYRCTQLCVGNQSTIGPLVAAIVTATSFQSLFGTLWIEQTAFLCNYAALYFLLESQEPQCKHPRLLGAAAGFAAVLSLLSKQNAFVLFIPVYVCAALRIPRIGALIQSAATFIAGAATGAVLFWIWLVTHDAVRGWIRHFYEIPRDIAHIRGGQTFTNRVFDLAVANTTLLPVILTVAAVVLALVLRSSLRIWPAALISLSFVLFRMLFQASTANDPPNSVSQIAISVGIGIGLIEVLCCQVASPGSNNALFRYRIPLHAAVSIAIAAYLGWYGASKSLARSVMQFPSFSTFNNYSSSPGLSGLKWGDPTLLSNSSNLTLREWDSLVNTVLRQHRPFFVWGDATVLYGLAHQPSASPLLYLGRNHSYRLKDCAVLDPMLLSYLQRYKVTMIIHQTHNYIEKDVHQLQDFPQSYAWVKRNFQLAEKSPTFEIYLFRDNLQASVSPVLGLH